MLVEICKSKFSMVNEDYDKFYRFNGGKKIEVKEFKEYANFFMDEVLVPLGLIKDQVDLSFLNDSRGINWWFSVRAKKIEVDNEGNFLLDF